MKHLFTILLGLAMVATAGAQTQSNTSADGSVQTSIQATAISSDGSDAEVRVETRTEASSDTEISSNTEEKKESSSATSGGTMTITSSTQYNQAEDGDEDRPVVVGTLPNSASPEVMTSIRAEAVGIDAKIRIINKIITPGPEAASGYLKIGDIKGESTEANASSTDDGKKGGNVEYEWKVEEGESAASKPKEIVVVGSKVRGWDPETKKEVLGVAPQNADEVQNETDLAFLLVRAAHDDQNIGEVEVRLDGESQVKVEYFQPARLFGFIPVGLAHSIEVRTNLEAANRVKINLPWWHIFAIKEVQVDKEALEEEISLNFEKIKTSASAESSVQAQSQTFQTISDAMKAAHDVAMSSIRNIK